MVRLKALAGFSQTKIATMVTLDGSQSKDTDGTIVSYKWAQTSGPVSTPLIVSPTKSITDVTGYNTPGVYVYQLTVTDNQGASGSGTVKVTVLAANLPPVANAGADIIIQLGKSN